ncbi:MAG: RHS repeat-associated core domain-containing protein [Pseudomonadota bacterium]
MFSRQILAACAALVAMCAGTAAAAATPAAAPVVSAAAPGNPGYTAVTLRRVTPADAATMMQSRTLPANLNHGIPASRIQFSVVPKPLKAGGKEPAAARMVQGAAAAGNPAQIVELARALKNDPNLIYEYVKNNIEFYPIWGVQKGALGALQDKQGTAFDQAALMVALLRQSGYQASYQLGIIKLTGDQLGNWLGVDTSAANPNSACALDTLLANGQIPIAVIVPASGGASLTCPTTAKISTISMEHVWVTATINGAQVAFDPSYKQHTIKPGINLAGAMGFDLNSYMNTARSGSATSPNGFALKGINRDGIRTSLTNYANTLTSYLRTNLPAATLDDVIGGMAIVHYDAGGASVTSSTLPYLDTGYTVANLPEITDGFRPTLRIQYAGIDSSFSSDALYGGRTTITYEVAGSSYTPVLKFDGAEVARGAAFTAGASNPQVSFTVTHTPYADANLATQQFKQSILPGGTYLVGNGWGPSGRGMVEFHRARLDASRAANASSSSEEMLGSSLAVLSSTWLAQVNLSDSLTDRIAHTHTLFHHQIGIAGYGQNAPYVDLPGNVISNVSDLLNSGLGQAAFYSKAMHSSIFESTSVQQTSGLSAVSTVKLLDLAISDPSGYIFDINAGNAGQILAALKPTDPFAACASLLQGVTGSTRIIVPAACTETENKWTGYGYFNIASAASNQTTISAIIGGGMHGGFASDFLTPSLYTLNTYSYTPSAFGSLTQSTPNTYGEPIDMTKGNYLYDHTDLSVGAGDFPLSLNFQRKYSSGLRLTAKALGNGWTHNYDISAAVGSDGYQGMGEDSALDAVAALVEKTVSVNLMTDASIPLDKLLTATVGQRWFGDQQVNNTVIVQNGLNGEVFVKLLDGSYNAPPGSAARLQLNADSTYSYETLTRTKYNFNSAGKIATLTDPSGVQVKFSYNGNDLSQVQNSLGRTLTLTTTGGHLTQVADGNGRSVGYGYTDNDLTTFTDTTLKSTTFKYDVPGRLTQFFYPSYPSQAFLTNVYDSLGRVKTQNNAAGKQYSYYFADSRSEEVAPDGGSSVSYLDGAGRIVRLIDQVGNETRNTYDGQGRLAHSVKVEGLSISFGGPYGALIDIVPGQMVDNTYDDATCAAAEKRCTHNLKSSTRTPRPKSGLTALVTSYTYDAVSNQVKTMTDPNQQVTNYSYTAAGLPQTVQLPADASGNHPSTTYDYTAYTAAGYPNFLLSTSKKSAITASTSVTTLTSYDPSNKYVPLTSTVDAGAGQLNLVTTYGYDAVGNLTHVDGPRSDVADTVDTQYDTERRVIQTTNALGKLATSGYDADGHPNRMAAQFGAQWLVSCRSYTASGKLLKAWGPALTASDKTCPAQAAPVPVTDYAYDDPDRLLRVTVNLPAAEGGNRVSETYYYADGKVKTQNRAVGSALAQTYASYTYSVTGQVATLADANGNLTTYTYDGHDRKFKTQFPDKANGKVSSTTDYEQYSYDLNGNLTTTRQRSGQSVTNGYDNLNRVTSRTYALASDNVNFGYDLLNRQTSANYANGTFNTGTDYDNAGRVLASRQGALSLSYKYDAAGNRTRLTWQDGVYVTSDYDALNRPINIKENGSVDLVGNYAYDDLSRRMLVKFGNGTSTTYGYNNQGQLAGLAHDLTGTTSDLAFGYAYNQAGNLLTDSWTNNQYQWGGGTNGTQAYVPNGQNQYASVAGTAMGYDGNGNQSSNGSGTFGYDQDNRLKTAGSGTLSYDALGRLRQTVLNGVTTRLLYDGNRLVAEYDASNTLLRRYAHGPRGDEPVVWYEGAGTANKSWLYGDHLGSVVALANSAGNSTFALSYGPYGEPNQTTGGRFRYTGQQYLPELNLYYYKARFYSPVQGRFMQSDPIGYGDNLNMYAYTGNNPISHADSTGMASDGGLGSSSLSYSSLDVQRQLATVVTNQRDALLNDPNLLLSNLTPSEANAINNQPWTMSLFFGTALQRSVTDIARTDSILSVLTPTTGNAPQDFLGPDGWGYDITGSSTSSILTHANRTGINAVVTYPSIPSNFGYQWINAINGP